MLTSALLDELARLRLSRQQASILMTLRQLSPEYMTRWRPKPTTRSESAVQSRMLRRLELRGFLELIVDDEFEHDRPTHMALSEEGRTIADSIARLDGSKALVLTSDLGTR